MSEMLESYDVVPEGIYMTIANDVQADNLLEEIRDLEVEFNRMELIANAKIEAIEAELARKKEKMLRDVQFRKDQLRAYFFNS